MLWKVRYKTRGPVQETLVETKDTAEGRSVDGPEGGRARAERFIKDLATPAAVLVGVVPAVSSSWRDDEANAAKKIAEDKKAAATIAAADKKAPAA